MAKKNTVETNLIAPGIRKLKKPKVVQVVVSGKPKLSVHYRKRDGGEFAVLTISKRVAEVLIAMGVTYEG